MSEVFYKITPSEVLRVTVTEQRVIPSQDIMSRFAAQAPVKVRNVAQAAMLGEAAKGNIGLCVTQKYAAYTIPVASLPMRCKFVMGTDGIMSPAFNSPPSATTGLELSWNTSAVPNMSVFFVVNIPLVDPPSSDVQFVVAMDCGTGRLYRLPTSNVYEDCKLCAGTFNSRGVSHMDVIGKAWNQFQMSAWNDHLSDRSGVEGNTKSKNMFRFKPDEKEGFIQQGHVGQWVDNCARVSVEYLNTSLCY